MPRGAGIVGALNVTDPSRRPVVREYQPAIDFFVNVPEFKLAEDVPSLTNDGRPKRWVVVKFLAAPRVESYGQLAVFLDIEGNRWDLLGHRREGPP